MHILLTNDDGITSDLLQLLAVAASKRGHYVTVSAPATQQSAKSHAFTIAEPVKVVSSYVKGANEAWAIFGTPVDSCRIGMMMLAKKPIDIVISGINNGMNVGTATYVSGTVGAAREAAFQNYPSIAVSVPFNTPKVNAEWFADYCIRSAERLLIYHRPEKSVCNINMPTCTPAEIKGAKVCPINTNIYRDDYTRSISPRGDLYFWLTPEKNDDSPVPGSDVDLLAKNYISISFLSPIPCDNLDFEDFPVTV